MRSGFKISCSGAATMGGLALVVLGATAPTASEKAVCHAWLERNFGAPPAAAAVPSPGAGRALSTPPFSFIFDGRTSGELLPKWTFAESTERLDADRTRRTLTWADPETKLEARAVLVEYGDFPTAEWTVYFRNRGVKDAPLLENILALDAVFERGPAGEFALHHAAGSLAREDDFEPRVTPLGPNTLTTLSGEKGRPTGGALSIVNLEEPGGHGTIIGVGWPGQWAARFTRDGGRALRVTIGQELACLKLRPGEEVRTPLVVLQFWTGGDRTRAQNIWRRWMVAHNMPAPRGRPVTPQFGACFGAARPSAAEEIAELDAYLADGAVLDHWIIDAGWYPMKDAEWWRVGTWDVDAARFPKGLREVADRAHAKGLDFIVWFEPERVSPGTRLDREHPDWILKAEGASGLLDLGNPAARAWAIATLDRWLTEQGVDHLRVDFNMDPLPHWRAADRPDRRGIAENFYVQGFLAFWDELLRRHPGMYIDTCASGGRRLDLETLRRSVPLLRSDYPLSDFTIGTAIGQQAQTAGLSSWIPYHGTGAPSSDMYTMRSAYCPAYRIGYNALDPKRNRVLFLRGAAESRRLIPYWLSDYYLLTPFGREKSAWLAWQFDAPGKGGGFVQAFRRDASASDTATLRLRGLEAAATYRITDMDSGAERRASGRSLANDGLVVRITTRPGSALVVYEKAD